MASLPDIVVYDTPGRDIPLWSHHTLRALYALHRKGLPYTVMSVDYPDIESTFEPTSLPPKDDPVERYEIPVVLFRLKDIENNSTDEYLMEPSRIIAKLDELVPDPPLPFASEHATEARALFSPALAPILQIGVGHIPSVLSDRSREGFLAKRHARWGKPLEEWVAERPKDMLLATAEPRLKVFADWLEGSGREGPFIEGAESGYADMTIVSILEYARLVGATDAFNAAMAHPAIARLYNALPERDGVRSGIDG
ncbi:hypothetical protein Sste5346_007586 [Sporothrix stenoceras]|uniref:Glutathione S-transferase UstS-like C-terminal domain-containing protein n=1 Tax=Sporothrix stenoceras TaxID=5173 RepID=A0ABR3YUJ0_9PEZI